jgi:hypothetical protein
MCSLPSVEEHFGHDFIFLPSAYWLRLRGRLQWTQGAKVVGARCFTR